MRLLVSLLAFLALSFLLSPTVAYAACSIAPPGNLKATIGSKTDQINLFWDISPSTDHYLLSYGLMSNQYIFGAINIGGVNTRSFTVKSLKPATKYFFRIGAVKDCTTFSNEASITTKKEIKFNVLGVSTHKKLKHLSGRI